MAKIFMGVRLRTLRQERGLTQVALAKAAGLSPSYLNQLEQDQRPLTESVLLKIHEVLGVDIQQFSEEQEARLLAQLRDAVATAPGQLSVGLPELREVAAKLPQVAQLLLAYHRRHQADAERLESLVHEVGDERSATLVLRTAPFEAVRDFFFAHRNYFDELDRASELLAREVTPGYEHADSRDGVAVLNQWLLQRLQQRHGIEVQYLTPQQDDDAREGARSAAGVATDPATITALGTGTAIKRHTPQSLRSFDPGRRVLRLALDLSPGQQAFQLATQLALIEASGLIDSLVAQTLWEDKATAALARIGLANYVAGALMLPYGRFLAVAERWRYDIDRLAQHFGVGFETICHRLSTLQRPEAPGVPFFFIRVDRAGNISKRQSATHFHFSKSGGTCPLWNVYEAFTQPGRIVPQLAEMPDGRVYLWIARTVTHEPHAWGLPGKTFSIGLGCDVQHASRLVYSQGMDLHPPFAAATPIGAGCKVCERPSCPQRAFPFVGKPLGVNEHVSSYAPYGAQDS